MTAESLRLVADVGGTNTRIALFNEQTCEFGQMQAFRNRDYPRLQDLVNRWLATLEQRPNHACIAIASPLDGDQVRMINMDWAFSRREFAEDCGIELIGWINDFVGNAHALPYLQPTDRVEIRSGGGRPLKKLAAVGPGTGLGGATVQEIAGTWRANACEPGHAGLSPATDEELAVFAALLRQVDNVYAELLVSGPGLLRLYQTLAMVRDQEAGASSPSEVSDMALAGEDALARDSLKMFCALLGSACGDFVLSNGAYGGLYLAGGIVPHMIPFLQASDFLLRLCDKGAMTVVLEQVPVYAITAEQPGLLGAAHAPLGD